MRFRPTALVLTLLPAAAVAGIGRRRLATRAVVGSTLLSLLLAATACSGSNESQAEAGGIAVSVISENLVPFEVTAGSPKEDKAGWVTHALTLKNASDQTVTLQQPQHGEIVGDSELFVSYGASCSYSASPTGQAALTACSDVGALDYGSVQPDELLTEDVALSKGLPGMNPLRLGTYEVNVPIRYVIGAAPERFDEWQSRGTQGNVTLRYTLSNV